jgi:hypothetical protein
MHQVSDHDQGITLVEFGFDLEHLFIRVDAARPMSELLAGGLGLSVNFLKPAGLRVTVTLNGRTPEAHLLERTEGDPRPVACAGLQVGLGRVLELRVPFTCLGTTTHAPVAFILALQRGPQEIEHHPRHRAIEFDVPDPQFAAANWTA